MYSTLHLEVSYMTRQPQYHGALPLGFMLIDALRYSASKPRHAGTTPPTYITHLLPLQRGRWVITWIWNEMVIKSKVCICFTVKTSVSFLVGLHDYLKLLICQQDVLEKIWTVKCWSSLPLYSCTDKMRQFSLSDRVLTFITIMGYDSCISDSSTKLA